MKRGAIWVVLTALMVTSLLLASCATSTTSTTTSTPTSTLTTTSTSANTTKTTTSLATTAATTATTTATGNWWDLLGTPQYGGTMTLRLIGDISNFDPYLSSGGITIFSAWMEKLHADDWTVNPAVFDFHMMFHPSQYIKGWLAQSWEMTDSRTYIDHLRHGIYWQNIPPANGREFTADDVVWDYDRMYGLGNGFTHPGPFAAGAPWSDLQSVTATDKYTTVFEFKTPNPEFIMETMQGEGGVQSMENPDAVKQWGDVNDWHHAIGTGPFILQDYVSGSSATLIKNPNYWGYDERYPQNKLPYIDGLKFLIIPDDATALAALRTGKLDVMDQMSLKQAQAMEQSNRGILQLSYPKSASFSLDPRNDVAPFKDIRVRQAMQQSIDLPSIAKSYFGGTCSPNPSSLTSNYLTGWGLPYDQWPQDLKDQYAYNPTAAKQLLAAAGYPNGFKTDIVASNDTDMDLLQIIKSYFSAVGIDMDIRVMDAASWNVYVRTQHKHDQLSCRGAGSLANAYEPIRQLSFFSTGNLGNTELISDPVYDAFYPAAMAATSVDGDKKILADANEYVARQHYCISVLQPSMFALYQPWLKGYNSQMHAISALGSQGGAQATGFYVARYWIDQKLKQSMGH